MKKLITLFFLIALAFSVQAQTRLTFTPATNDSVVGAVTKYCTLANPITARWNGVIEVYLTRSVGSGDSTQVTIEGSQNGTTWYAVDYGTPRTSGASVVYHSSILVTTIVGTGGILLSPNWFFNCPYLRVKVQHYTATNSMKITRAAIYLKK